ncbi:hypothetical protein G9A89_000369, partial [Geosiphon pyriformis]
MVAHQWEKIGYSSVPILLRVSIGGASLMHCHVSSCNPPYVLNGDCPGSYGVLTTISSTLAGSILVVKEFHPTTIWLGEGAGAFGSSLSYVLAYQSSSSYSVKSMVTPMVGEGYMLDLAGHRLEAMVKADRMMGNHVCMYDCRAIGARYIVFMGAVKTKTRYLRIAVCDSQYGDSNSKASSTLRDSRSDGLYSYALVSIQSTTVLPMPFRIIAYYKDKGSSKFYSYRGKPYQTELKMASGVQMSSGEPIKEDSSKQNIKKYSCSMYYVKLKSYYPLEHRSQYPTSHSDRRLCYYMLFSVNKFRNQKFINQKTNRLTISIPYHSRAGARAAYLYPNYHRRITSIALSEKPVLASLVGLIIVPKRSIQMYPPTIGHISWGHIQPSTDPHEYSDTKQIQVTYPWYIVAVLGASDQRHRTHRPLVIPKAPNLSSPRLSSNKNQLKRKKSCKAPQIHYNWPNGKTLLAKLIATQNKTNTYPARRANCTYFSPKFAQAPKYSITHTSSRKWVVAPQHPVVMGNMVRVLLGIKLWDPLHPLDPSNPRNYPHQQAPTNLHMNIPCSTVVPMHGVISSLSTLPVPNPYEYRITTHSCSTKEPSQIMRDIYSYLYWYTKAISIHHHTRGATKYPIILPELTVEWGGGGVVDQTLYPSKWELSGSNRAKCRYKGQPTHQGSGTNQIKIQITIPKAGLIPYPSLNPQVQTHKLLTYLKPCRLLSRKGRSCVTTNSKNQDQYYPLGPHIYCPAAYTCYSIGDLQRADIETHRTPLREVPNKGPNNYCILRDPANGLKGQVCKTKNRDYTHRGSAPTIHLSKVLNVIHKPKRRHNPFAGGNTSISPVGLPITHNHLHQVGSYSIGELYGSQESQVIPLLEAGPYGNHCRFYLSNWITTDAPNRAIRSICTWVPYTGQGSEAQQVMGTKVQCKVWDEPILSYDYTKSDPYTSKPLYAPRTMGNPISIQRYQILPLWVDQLSTQTHQTQAQEYKGLPYPYAPSPCKRTLMDLVVSDMSYYLIVPLGTVVEAGK